MDPEATDSKGLSCEHARESNSLSCSSSTDCLNSFSFHAKEQSLLVCRCAHLRNEQSSESPVEKCCNSYDDGSGKCTSLSVEPSKEKTIVSSPHKISVKRRASVSHIPILSQSDVAVQYRNSQRKLRSTSVDYVEWSSPSVHEAEHSNSVLSFSHCCHDPHGRNDSLCR